MADENIIPTKRPVLASLQASPSLNAAPAARGYSHEPFGGVLHRYTRNGRTVTVTTVSGAWAWLSRLDRKASVLAQRRLAFGQALIDACAAQGSR